MGASSKIIVTPFAEHNCDCPFYMKDAKGEQQCFFKRAMTAQVAQAFVKTPGPQFTDALWKRDCGGDWELCSVLPIFYDMAPPVDEEVEEEEEATPQIMAPTFDEETVERPDVAVTPQYVLADPTVDSFDPFGKNHDDDTDAFHPTVKPVKETAAQQKARAKKEREEYSVKIKHHLAPVKVLVRKVENPFAVKAQAIVYPTNSLLTVSNRRLNWMTGNSVQDECDKIKGTKQMGFVYITSGGGPGTQVVPKRIYHAVVAGSSNLVNEDDIKYAMRRALIQADKDGVELLSMIPADGGTLDIELAALNQMQAVYEFLRSYPVQNLKWIFVVMEDETSQQVYEEYRKRIFEGE